MPPARKSNLIAEFKNIRTLPSGYQVAVQRNGEQFTKHFAGHSPEALAAASRWRDKMRKLLGPRRQNAIPSRVLKALELTEPVVGVSRSPKRQIYQVGYRARSGRFVSQSFRFTDPAGEIEAYREAVNLRRKLLRAH